MKKNELNEPYIQKYSILKLLLIMKLIFLFAAINVFALSATGFSQPVNLNFDLKDVTVKEGCQCSGGFGGPFPE